jgi:hypothetical protein
VKHARMPKMVWVLTCVAVSIFFLWQVPWGRSEGPTDIVFSVKVFHDSARTTGDGIVSITGTLTGDGVGYKNNAVLIACFKDSRACLTYSVQQIGPNQIGRLDIPISYPIVKWASDEIVATGSADLASCRKVTISVVRKSETAVWVEEPINQARAACIDADTKLYKWTIEDPPFWKAMRERRK